MLFGGVISLISFRYLFYMRLIRCFVSSLFTVKGTIGDQLSFTSQLFKFYVRLISASISSFSGVEQEWNTY